jgi:hypothetical protein
MMHIRKGWDAEVVKLLGFVVSKMKMPMILWNVRGLNIVWKQAIVRNMLKDWKGDIICLQKAKIVEMDQCVVRSLWRSPFGDWVTLDAVGTARGGGASLG